MYRLWLKRFATLTLVFSALSCAITPANGDLSIAGAAACDYDSLGPGGGFEGTPDIYGNSCKTEIKINAPAEAYFPYVIHPELGIMTQGWGMAESFQDESLVYAAAKEGGGGLASDTIYYTMLSTFTHQPDPSPKESTYPSRSLTERSVQSRGLLCGPF